MELISLEKLFQDLNQASVRYLVVGGLAVVAHGYLRFTADVDLFVDLEPDNIKRAVSVFSEQGYKPRAPVLISEFIDVQTRTRWIQEKNLKVFSLWNPSHPGNEVDVIIEPPMDFIQAEKNSQIFEAGPELKMKVIGLEDLINMKRIAGRQKDIDDIENLRKLRAMQDDE